MLEVLVVICLIFAITGLAALSYRPFWEKEQLRTAASDLIRQIQLARMKAILENRSYRLVVDQGKLKTFRYENGEWREWSSYRLVETVDYQMRGGMHFSGKGFASPKTIRLNKDELKKKVIVNINGRIRSE